MNTHMFKKSDWVVLFINNYRILLESNLVSIYTFYTSTSFEYWLSFHSTFQTNIDGSFSDDDSSSVYSVKKPPSLHDFSDGKEIMSSSFPLKSTIINRMIMRISVYRVIWAIMQCKIFFFMIVLSDDASTSPNRRQCENGWKPTFPRKILNQSNAYQSKLPNMKL